MSDLYFAFNRNGESIENGFSDSTDAAKALQRHDTHGCVVRRGVVLRWGTDVTRSSRERLQALLADKGVVDAKARETLSTPDVTVAPVPTPTSTPVAASAPLVTASKPVTKRAPVATAAPATAPQSLLDRLVAKFGNKSAVGFALGVKSSKVYAWRDLPAAHHALATELLDGTTQPVRVPLTASECGKRSHVPSKAKASKRTQQPTPRTRTLINASPPPPVAASTPAPDDVTMPRAEWQRITTRLTELETLATAAVAQRENEAPTGRKDDQGKRDWTLVPWDGLACVVEVLEFGARKYARDNWRVVPGSTARYERALARHVIAHLAGEPSDAESGLSHLAHAACCLLFLLAHREAP